MNRRHWIFTTLCASAFTSCGMFEDESPAAVSPSQPSKLPWPGVRTTRVTGYRFRDPAGSSGMGSSFVYGGLKTHEGIIEIDEARLRKLTVSSAELNAPQVQRLLKSAFDTGRNVPQAACYEPHHLFLFRDDADRIRGVIEVCFQCTALLAIPENTAWTKGKTDFIGLASLCQDTGLGSGFSRESAQRYSDLIRSLEH